MLTNPTEFLQTHFEELEYLVETEQWEDADLMSCHLSQFLHLFDAEMLDKYYYWIDNIQTGLMYE
jgi:hypothetical protein